MPCLDCSQGQVTVVCSGCDEEHLCICKACVGQGYPVGLLPCKSCLNRKGQLPLLP